MSWTYEIGVSEQCLPVRYNGPITGTDQWVLFEAMPDWHKTKLERGDRIAAISGKPVSQMTWDAWEKEWHEGAARRKSGESDLVVELTVLRGDQTLTLDVPISERANVERYLRNRPRSYVCNHPETGEATRIDVYQVAEETAWSRINGGQWVKRTKETLDQFGIRHDQKGRAGLHVGKSRKDEHHIFTAWEIDFPFNPLPSSIHNDNSALEGFYLTSLMATAGLSVPVGNSRLQPALRGGASIPALFWLKPVFPVGATVSYTSKVGEDMWFGPFVDATYYAGWTRSGDWAAAPMFGGGVELGGTGKEEGDAAMRLGAQYGSDGMGAYGDTLPGLLFSATVVYRSHGVNWP